MSATQSPTSVMPSATAGAERAASTFLQRLLDVTIVLLYLLVVLGGVVRAFRLQGCPDWPLCYGRWLPPPDVAAWVTWLHRLDASIVGLFLVASTALAWAELTITHPVTRMLALTVPLLLVEAGVGGLAAMANLPARFVALHLGLSLIILAQVLMAAVYARYGRRRWARAASARWIDTTLLVLYVFLLSGALVTQSGAAWACPDWPLCRGQVWPTGDWQALLNVGHRYLALVVGGLLAYTWYHARRDTALHPGARRWLHVALVFFLVSTGLGAIAVWTDFHGWASVAHLVVGVTVWSALVLASAQAYAVEVPRKRRERPAGQAKPVPRWRAYVGLMKPGIVALLVVTTLTGMIIAARGWPDSRLLFWTVLASILSAGGANAINSYYDRDIDGRMARTSRRPLPQGLVPPRKALYFALVCVAAGVLIMTVMVNPLAGVLTALGAFWYAVVYTQWLKRRTVQNIVIGGAAGAMAPVVGWAAVTQRVDLLAVILFLLIFLWTPPHTWAFTLVVLRDYERVGIPMLPVVKGIPATTREIVVYSWLMAAVTLAPSVFGILGTTYTLGMVVLNVVFLYLAHRLHQRPEKALANRLYQYSNAYLYLAFALMAFDRMGGLL